MSRGALRAGIGAVGIAGVVGVAGATAALLLGGGPRELASPTRPGASDWLEVPTPTVRFATLDGDSVSLADYRGRVVLLNFWGTWCAPCLVEIPHLIQVHRELRSLGGTVVGPAIESGTPEEIRGFGRRHGMTWPLWIADPGLAVERFGAIGYPYTLLIDRDGVVRRLYLGPQTAGTLLSDVERLLGRERS